MVLISTAYSKLNNLHHKQLLGSVYGVGQIESIISYTKKYINDLRFYLICANFKILFISIGLGFICIYIFLL